MKVSIFRLKTKECASGLECEGWLVRIYQDMDERDLQGVPSGLGQL